MKQLNNKSADFKSGIDKKPAVVPKKTSQEAINVNDKTAQKAVYGSDPGQDIKIEIGSKQELEIAGVKYLIEAFLGGSGFFKR